MATSPGRPSFDQALKGILLRGHDGVLALVAPDLAFRGERSPELPAVARLADVVWEVEDHRGQRGRLHLEVQTGPDAQIGERLAEYAIRLWRRDRLPVRSVVIFLRPTQTLPASPFVVEFGSRETLRFHYDVVRLWEIPAERVLETPYVDLWPLAGVMAEVTEVSVLAAARQIATAPVEARERSDLMGLLALLAGLRLPARTVLEALRRDPMIEELVRQSSVAEALLDEGLSEGMRQGLNEGMRESVRLAVEGRLGPLDEELRAAIERADQPALRAVLAHIATDTPEQLRTRLGVG